MWMCSDIDNCIVYTVSLKSGPHNLTSEAFTERLVMLKI